MIYLELAAFLASILLFYYSYRLYGVFSDTKLQGAMQLLLNGFLLLVLRSTIGIMQSFGYLQIQLEKGDITELVALIAYIVIVAAMVRLRRVFLEFEVQKKAIKMLRNVFE